MIIVVLCCSLKFMRYVVMVFMMVVFVVYRDSGSRVRVSIYVVNRFVLRLV